jgi:DNA invertase Pin-like site-specific DNA recombinase
MFSLLAELESKQIRDRVQTGMNMKARSTSGHLGKRCPFGYNFIKSEKVDEEGTYVINDDEATVVRRIFDIYLTGTSMREIADALKSEGVMTKRGGVWEASTVQSILNNPFYSGWDCWDGILRRGTNPAIISIETFNRAQRRIAEKRRRADKLPKLIIEGMN